MVRGAAAALGVHGREDGKGRSWKARTNLFWKRGEVPIRRREARTQEDRAPRRDGRAMALPFVVGVQVGPVACPGGRGCECEQGMLKEPALSTTHVVPRCRFEPSPTARHRVLTVVHLPGPHASRTHPLQAPCTSGVVHSVHVVLQGGRWGPFGVLSFPDLPSALLPSSTPPTPIHPTHPPTHIQPHTTGAPSKTQVLRCARSHHEPHVDGAHGGRQARAERRDAKDGLRPRPAKVEAVERAAAAGGGGAIERV